MYICIHVMWQQSNKMASFPPWWHMPVISGLRRLRQYCKLEASLICDYHTNQGYKTLSQQQTNQQKPYWLLPESFSGQSRGVCLALWSLTSFADTALDQ